MATRPPSPPPLHSPSRPQDATEDDEMPLLFMENLPSDFQQNAQLAALVTFMGSEEEEDENESSAFVGGKHKKTRRTHRQNDRQPYARTKKSTTDNPKQKNQRSAQELALYLSLFHVSSE